MTHRRVVEIKNAGGQEPYAPSMGAYIYTLSQIVGVVSNNRYGLHTPGEHLQNSTLGFGPLPCEGLSRDILVRSPALK